MKKRKRYHSITDIVATVYCEQKAVYDRERGDARPLDVRIKAATGTFEHLRFQVEGQTSQIVDKRCFIASQVYSGEGRCCINRASKRPVDVYTQQPVQHPC